MRIEENNNEGGGQAAPSVREFDLNVHVHRLLLDEPFFASISRRVDKRADPGLPFVAGVQVSDNGMFELVYNPGRMSGLSDIHRKGVLVHEFRHIVFQHLTGRMPSELKAQIESKKVDKKLMYRWNIATDLAINSDIAGILPEWTVVPGRKPYEKMPFSQTAEWYFKRLGEEENKKGDKQEQSANDSGQPQAGEGQLQPGGGQPSPDQAKGGANPDEASDAHSQWYESDPQASEIASERIRELVKEAAEECGKQGNWGSISSSLRKEIMSTIARTVDWRKVLRYFIKSSQRASKTSSIKRINRRYPYMHPGRKVRRASNIAISIDQSGSVSDQMLSMFFAELNGLSKFATFTVIPFDSQVESDKVYVWKKGETRKKERVMFGGTNFDAPTQYVNERTFDGHIILTDMCAPKPKKSKCQRMWMTTPENMRYKTFTTSEKILVIGS